jgi:signal transduction histidine kinase
MDEEADRMQHVLDELAHLHDEVLGTLELNKEELDLSEWLPNLLLPWRQAASDKEISWHEEIPTENLRITADPLRMAQVIGNLTSNAVKYTPRGGEIKISTGKTVDQIWIKFGDSGPGISESEQQMVFEPFYRGDQGRKIKQGMGLGLSIARDIIHAHGGEIELLSEPDAGSQFTIWLPK